MAVVFIQGQVAVSDPNPSYPNPSAISNDKSTHSKTVKLTSANFATAGVSTLVIVLPADSTILSFRLWVKTQLAGNGITAATLALGNVASGAQFYAANASGFGAAGTFTVLTPVLGIMQNYNVPSGSDIQIYATGASTTGTPTSGEMYLTCEYVR